MPATVSRFDIDVRPGFYVTRNGGVAVVTRTVDKPKVFQGHVLFKACGFVRLTTAMTHWRWARWYMNGGIEPELKMIVGDGYDLCDRWDPEFPVPASYRPPGEYLREYGLTLDPHA